MSRPRYKQKCGLCKQNMVIIYSSRQFPICVVCHMKQIAEPVTDPQYKQLLDIPQELYQQSLFLRNIKQSYLRFGSLTEKQIEVFKKAVQDLKNSKKNQEEKP